MEFSPDPRSPQLVNITSPDSDTDYYPSSAAYISRKQNKQAKSDAELLGEGGEENVHVCIRVRPFNKRELDLQRATNDEHTNHLRSVVEMPEGMAGKVNFREFKNGQYRLVEEFKYNKTFWSIPEEQQPHQFSPVTQEDVYDHVGYPILNYAFHGFNNCVFAYGQTGSGKTHTMMGDFSLDEETASFGDQAGIIPRLCRALFEKISAYKANVEEGIIKTIDVKLNAIEIYNEQVRDLFWRNTPGRNKFTVLKVRIHPTEGAFVDQLSVLNPTSWRDCLKKIEKGVSERTVAATLMNDESSRSHSVFQITLTQAETVHVCSDDPEDRFSKPITYKKVSKINLVDLAGSERNKKSGARGQQLKEAANINQSLTTLKKVIDALVTNSKDKKHVLIPFRESTLTLLLSDSLGGNSKTTMIACVSPHFDNQEETLLTLRYANRTGNIINTTRINEDSAAKQALALKHHILELQRRLAEGPVDEQAEELLDQIEIGRNSLKEMEEANRTAEQVAVEMRTQAKQAEGARFTSAFYNTLKMAMLVQQKEELDSKVRDLEKGVMTTRDENAMLRENVKTTTINEINYSKSIEKLTEESKYKEEKDMLMDLQAKRLLEENEVTKRKYDHEIELRYAQKLVNAHKSHLLREEMEKELSMLQKDCDEKLANVIMDAAEQYELQVREYADSETCQRQKIKRLQKELNVLIDERERCERESSILMANIRETDNAHNARVVAIETEWNDKYEAMKSDYQKQIEDLEKEMFDEARKRDLEYDESSMAESAAHSKCVAKLEQEIVKKESAWKLKVSMAFNSHGDKLNDGMHKQEQESRLRAGIIRRDCEKQIGELVGRLNRVKRMEKDHEECLKQLQHIFQTMASTHDRIIESPPHDYSAELLQLTQKLKRFDGPLVSSPIPDWCSRVNINNDNSSNNVDRSIVTTGSNGTTRALTYDRKSPSKSTTATKANTNSSAINRGSSVVPPVMPAQTSSTPTSIKKSVVYTTIGTPVKAFNIFSQEKFDAINSHRFSGHSPQVVTTTTAGEAADTKAQSSSGAGSYSMMSPGRTTPRREIVIPTMRSSSGRASFGKNPSVTPKLLADTATTASGVSSTTKPTTETAATTTCVNASSRVHKAEMQQAEKRATTPRTGVSRGIYSAPIRKK